MTTLYDKVAQFKADADLNHDYVHGPASGPGSVIETESGPVPTLAKQRSDLAAQLGADAVLNQSWQNAQEAVASNAAAQQALLQTEASRDASFAIGPKYPSESAGRLVTGDGQTFLVQGSGDAACYEYRRTNSASSVLIATYPSLAGVGSKVASASATNLWRDAFLRYAKRLFDRTGTTAENGRTYLNGGTLRATDPAITPYGAPYIEGSGASATIDRAVYFDELPGVKIGDVATVRVAVRAVGVLKCSAYVRDAGVGGAVRYSSALETLTVNGRQLWSHTFTRPADGSAIMIRVTSDVGYVGNFYVLGYGMFRGDLAMPLVAAPISMDYVDERVEALRADVPAIATTAANAAVAGVTPQNLFQDAFLRRIGSLYAGQTTVAEGGVTVLNGVVLASHADNPYATPCAQSPAGSTNVVDRLSPWSQIPGVKAGATVTARIAVVCTGSVQMAVFQRDTMTSTVLSSSTQTKVCAGYTEFEITVTRHATAASIILRAQKSTGNTAELIVVGYGLWLGSAAYALTEAPVGAQDVAAQIAAGGSVTTASAQAMVAAESSVNICPDAFFRRSYARSGAGTLKQENGLSYLFGAGSLLASHASNPYGTPVVQMTPGASYFDRHVYTNEAPLKVGDTVTVSTHVYVSASSSVTVSFYQRAGVGGTVIGSAQTKTVAAEGVQTISATITLQAGAGVLLLRHSTPGGNTGDVLVLATQVTKGVLAHPLTEDAPNRADLAAVTSTPSVDDIVLPRKIYALVGSTGAATEQLNVYWEHVLKGYYKDKIVDVDASWGRQLNECYRIEPGNTAVDAYNVSSGSFALTASIKSYKNETLKSASTTIELVSKAASTPAVRLLGIGDSITRNGLYLKQVSDKLSGVTLQGIRHYDTDPAGFYREGRGGWSLNSYFTFFARSDWESPFVFPDGISGPNYRGNVGFWKNIVTDTTGYDYGGFQKLARGWADSGPYVYDTSTGYPLSPQAGWVVFDSSKAAGVKFQEWSGSAWVASATQPTTWSFDFAKYLSRYAVIFGGGLPTHIGLMLGANDFGSTEPTDAALATYIGRVNTLIAQAQAAITGVKFVICLPVMGGTQDGMATNYKTGQTAEGYRRNLQVLCRELLTAYDTDLALAQGIYVAPINMVVDPVYGFNVAAEAVNKYSTTSVPRVGDGIHPSDTVGHMQMGDCLAAVIQRSR